MEVTVNQHFPVHNVQTGTMLLEIWKRKLNFIGEFSFNEISMSLSLDFLEGQSKEPKLKVVIIPKKALYLYIQSCSLYNYTTGKLDYIA